jgi:periplasmic protein TonB
MTGATQGWRRRLPLIAAGVACIALSVLAVYFLREFLSQKVEPQKKVVQEVRIVRPPPPPPDVKPPPPPPPEEETDVPEPMEQEPVPSNEPPPGDLGIDAAGEGAGDGFGLVGRPGGRDILASRGSSFGWYAGLVKNEILERLSNETRIRSGSYTIVVRLWVRGDGTVEKANVVGTTGDRERDRAIEAALSQLARVSQAPPADMPQPISLRIVSRA